MTNNTATTATEHNRDADCAGHIDGDTCSICGVYHGDACPDCGGRGYHEDSCPSQLATEAR